MTAQQRNEHRQIYNQLRLALVYPGDTIAGVTKPYAPVDKWAMTFDELLSCPDTPRIAYLRGRYDKGLLATVEMRGMIHG